MKDLMSMLTFYAISPIHAGSGAATSHVDLPIQRERHTNWPHIQSSAVKGAIRAHFRDFASEEEREKINYIFGSDKDNDKRFKGNEDGLASIVSFSDANLLAFPMRSNVAPFVWVTCPAVLKRLAANQRLIGMDEVICLQEPEDEQAFVLQGNISGNVLLEDAVIQVDKDQLDVKWPDSFPATDKLILISDAMFDYAVSHCTEIQTNIKIDHETGTAKEGGLRYQELLPADSVLYSVANFSGRVLDNGNEFRADMIQKYIQKVLASFMQIGGDDTLGRGICKLEWIQGGKS